MANKNYTRINNIQSFYTMKSYTYSDVETELSINPSRYLLLEIDMQKVLNRIGNINPNYYGIVFRLTPNIQLKYGTYDVYDYDSRAMIGRYVINEDGLLEFLIENIYLQYGKVKLMLTNPRTSSYLGRELLINPTAEMFMFSKTAGAKPVVRAEFNLNKSNYIEGEMIDWDSITANVLYYDGQTQSINKATFIETPTTTLTINNKKASINCGGYVVEKDINVFVNCTNTGLKSYNRALSGSIGSIGYNVNTYIYNSNLILTLPLIESGGVNPISYGIIYNHQDRGIKGEFGYGMRDIYDIYITQSSGCITVRNSDGSIDQYELVEDNEYYCEENNKKITMEVKSVDGDSDEYVYKIKDKIGNVILYNSNNEKIESINYANGFSISYKPEEGVLLSNGDNKKITYVRDEFGRITDLVYLENNQQKWYTTLAYDDNEKLENITVNRYDNIIENYCLEQTNESFRILDDKIRYAVKFYFIGNNIYKVEEDLYTVEEPSENYILTETRLIYNIERNKNETVITNRKNDTLTIVYNKGLEAYEYDDRGNVNIINYNSNKKVEYQSNTMNISLLKENGVILTTATKVGGIVVEDKSLSTRAEDLGFTTNKEISASGTLDFGNVNISGSKEEALSLVLLAKQTSASDSLFNCYLKVSLYNGSKLINYEEYGFNSLECDNEAKLVVLGISPKDNYTKAHVELYTFGISVEVSELILCKCDYGTYYKYDENNNIISIMNSKTHLFKGYSNNYLESEIVKGNQENVYSYDENMNPEKIYKIYNVKETREHDAKNRIIKRTTKSKSNGSIEEEYTYSGDNLISVSDSLGNFTEYNYYDDNRISSVTSNGITTEMSYTKENLTGINTEGVDVNYTLDSRGNINEITAENGSIYTFEYDYKNRLISVLLNNTLVIEYEYDDADNVTTKKYSNNNYYTFTYEDDLLKNINYINSSICSYEYDEYDRLISINDLANSLITNYTYDEYNRINKIENSEVVLEYKYHESDNDISIKRKVNDYEVNEWYNNIINTNVAFSNKLRGLFYDNSNYAGSMFINDGILRSNKRNKTTILNSNITEDMLTEYENVPALRIDSENSNIVVEATNHHNCGMVGFWFNKAYSGGNNYYPLYSKYNKQNDVKLCVDYDNEKISLILENGQDQIIATTPACSVEGWNFFGLYWKSVETTFEFTLRLNNEVVQRSVTTSAQLSLDEGVHRIANIRTTAGISIFNGYIAAMMVGISDNISNDMLTKYYETTKMYLINDPQLNLRTEAVDYSVANEYKKIEGYEIYPLHGNANSINGVKPKSIISSNENIHDKAKMYNFNISNRRYCFEASGNIIEYEFGNSSKATICANVYLYKLYGVQYIFESCDSNNNRLGLFVNTNGVVGYKLGDVTYLTSLSLEEKTWNFVSLSYSLLSGNIYQCLIRLNDEVYSATLNPSTSFGQMTTVIGNNKENTNPMFGQLEMLLVSTTKFLNSTEYNLIKSKLKIESKTNEYDDLGRLVKQGVHSSGNNIVCNYPEYDDVVDNYTGKKTKFSYKVKQERIRTGNSQLVVREYGYGSGVNKNNVVSITDLVFGNKSYGYDFRGYLTNDNGTSIIYDDNGNIKSYGSNTYTYDSTVKDKLKSYNGNVIVYSGLYPTIYSGYNYSYEGNKLVSVIDSNFDDMTGYYDYKYNYNGLRSRKTISYEYNDDRDSEYVETYYYYDGNRLITEYRSDNDRLDFLYDSNGLLYGFINNKTSRYYYVRDILQNILGIVDSNGNLVVKYDYNAFGKVTIVTDTSGINLATRNPFRYKGYYYDEETGLFWCNSRYYSPELCRFISPDSIEYLDPQSINGLNLYCYCENDPVNKYDPSGHAWDYVLDAAFIIWGVVDLVNGGYKDWKNWVALGGDLVFAVVPFIPAGAGQVIKIGNKIDNAADVVSAINKMDNINDITNLAVIGRNMDRVRDTAIGIGRADDIYDMWKGFDSIKEFNKPLGYALSGLDNGGWIFGKLRKGYTIIDIGITTTHRGMGWYYGIERFIMAQWKYRNIWKLPVNLL